MIEIKHLALINVIILIMALFNLFIKNDFINIIAHFSIGSSIAFNWFIYTEKLRFN